MTDVPAESPSILARVGPGAVAPALAEALRSGAAVSATPAGVFDLTGAGALACMQGLLTNDIERPGDGAFVYGALLTPKGMILVDGWVGRRGDTVRFTVPAEGRERAAQIFQRTIPPRLARVSDRTPELQVLRLTGPAAIALADAARLAPLPPEPGRVLLDQDIEVSRASAGAPFTLQWIGAADRIEEIGGRLRTAGAAEGNPDALQMARILAGWPGLWSEVDDKTLPQEIRFDEIGGVSYTKGCYTGQETVSRVHFRGHPNRGLRGVRLAGEPPHGWRTPQPATIGDRDVGRLTSIAWVPDGPGSTGGAWLGLAVLRRDVPDGASVRIGMIEARVTSLPLPLTRFEPA